MSPAELDTLRAEFRQAAYETAQLRKNWYAGKATADAMNAQAMVACDLFNQLQAAIAADRGMAHPRPMAWGKFLRSVDRMRF